MGNGGKIALAVVALLVVALGGAYGAAKFGLVKLPNNPQLYSAYKALKLPVPKPATATAKAAPPDPLASEKKALAAMREAFDKERAAWEEQKQAKERAATASSATNAPSRVDYDPKSIARLATIYDQMQPKAVAVIFSRLPEPQVIALLRRMDEKQVGQILALEKPERAARLSLNLATPPPRLALSQ